MLYISVLKRSNMILLLPLILSIFIFTQLAAEQYIIESISIQKNKITIVPNKQFKREYLTEDFFVYFQEPAVDLTSLPESIATIPFILSTIAMILHSGQTWHIATMDEDLFYSLQKIQQIFKLFYPQEQWNGQLIPATLVSNTLPSSSDPSCAVLYSGGLDAICASLSHRDKQQLLITIGGNDIPLKKRKQMWLNVQEQARSFAKKYKHNNAFIVSNFFSFIKKHNKKINQPLQRWWWYYTLQSLSYAGLSAPLLYIYGLKKLYLGSSFTIDYPFGWGTHPLLDNNISYFGVTVHHENADFSRQDKITWLKKLAHHNKIETPQLRVCWNNEKFGGNCCNCEKCLRTINNIIVELEEPRTYGFDITLREAANRTYKFITTKHNFQPEFLNAYVVDWVTIQQRVKQQLQSKVSITPKFKKYLKWLIAIDFEALWPIKQPPSQQQWQFYKRLWQLGVKGQTALDTLHALSGR